MSTLTFSFLSYGIIVLGENHFRSCRSLHLLVLNGKRSRGIIAGRSQLIGMACLKLSFQLPGNVLGGNSHSAGLKHLTVHE